MLGEAPEEVQDKIRRAKGKIELYSETSQSIKARIRAKLKLARKQAGGKGQKEYHPSRSSGEADQEKANAQNLDHHGQGVGQENNGQGGGRENRSQGVSQTNKRQGNGQDINVRHPGQDNEGQGGGQAKGTTVGHPGKEDSVGP